MTAKVLRFPKPDTVKRAAYEMMTEALASLGQPHAVVIVVLGKDGAFAVRSATDGKLSGFDLFARAEALMHKDKMAMMGED